MVAPDSNTSATDLLAETLTMRQSEYYRRYLADPDNLSNREYAVMEFFQACLGSSRRAIEHLMDRTDGPLATPVQIIYPKVYYKFPFVQKGQIPASNTPSEPIQKMYSDSTPGEQINSSPEEVPEDTSPLSSLRDTIRRMSREKVKLRNDILEAYEINQVQLSMGGVISPDLRMGSVVAANFLRLSSSPAGAMALFDQLDGKIATVYQALGGDMYLLDTSTEPPKDLQLIWSNEQQCYIAEAPQTTNQWVDALKLLESSK